VLEADDSWRASVPSDVTSNEIPDEGRLVVIVLDDSALPGTSTRPQEQAKAIANTVIDQLAPADLAAVVFTLNSSSAQSFTNDKGRLRRAVAGLRPGFTGLDSFGGFKGTEIHFERGSIRTLDFIAEKLIEAVTVTILAADGRKVLDRTGTLAAARFEPDRQTDLRMELPLPAFEPGEYLLTIAIAGSDDDAATRRVPFRVR
jgi:hypothetical protein